MATFNPHSEQADDSHQSEQKPSTSDYCIAGAIVIIALAVFIGITWHFGIDPSAYREAQKTNSHTAASIGN